MKLKKNPLIAEKYKSYPPAARKKMKALRTLIIEAAKEIETVEELEETLKWGEPSYLTKKGTTIRIDWKSKNPDQYAMYFNCQSSMVPTIKVLYGDLFKYEKDRALVFDLKTPLPEKEMKECIALALTYHSVKHKPLLGRFLR